MPADWQDPSERLLPDDDFGEPVGKPPAPMNKGHLVISAVCDRPRMHISSGPLVDLP